MGGLPCVKKSFIRIFISFHRRQIKAVKYHIFRSRTRHKNNLLPKVYSIKEFFDMISKPKIKFYVFIVIAGYGVHVYRCTGVHVYMSIDIYRTGPCLKTSWGVLIKYSEYSTRYFQKDIRPHAICNPPISLPGRDLSGSFVCHK